jgi:Carbohydrate-selective porin, OprB family
VGPRLGHGQRDRRDHPAGDRLSHDVRDGHAPARLRHRGYLDTSRYNDPFYNTRGTSLALNRGSPLVHKNRISIYAQAQQMVWRPDPSSTRGLTLFAGVLFGIGGVEQVNSYYLVGAVDKGPFTSRPNDTLSFMTYTNIFNQRVVKNYAAALRRSSRRTRTPGRSACSFPSPSTTRSALRTRLARRRRPAARPRLRSAAATSAVRP